MNLFEINFYEEDYKWRNYYSQKEIFNDDDFLELMGQADVVLGNEKETSHRRAEACVKKFQLLETRHKLAPKLLEQALVFYPDMPQALTSMGCFYLRIKDRDNAIAFFNKAIGSNRLYPYSWLQKAFIETDKEEKFRFLYEYIKLNPDSIIGYEERRRLLDDIENNMNDLLAYKKPKLIKINLQSAIDDYSELIRLVPNESSYYENRADLYIKMSMIEFMLSDDDEEFPCVNNSAVKDMEKLMFLTSEHGYANLITIVNNMFRQRQLPVETIRKYIEQMISDLSPDTNEFWIAQLLSVEYYSMDESEQIQTYTNIINSVKNGSYLQIYSYYKRSHVYFHMKEYEKALADNEAHIKLCSLLTDNQYDNSLETDLYFAMESKAETLEAMKDFKGLINEYTKILETFNADKRQRFILPRVYMERAKIYEENNDVEKALADYSTVIELGFDDVEYNIRDAYAARIEINKKLGNMDKVSADYKQMAELKNPFDCLLSAFDDFKLPEFEIID